MQRSPLTGQMMLVSILTRPEGRVQPEPRPIANIAAMFQSSPVPKDGCNKIYGV